MEAIHQKDINKIIHKKNIEDYSIDEFVTRSQYGDNHQIGGGFLDFFSNNPNLKTLEALKQKLNDAKTPQNREEIKGKIQTVMHQIAEKRSTDSNIFNQKGVFDKFRDADKQLQVKYKDAVEPDDVVAKIAEEVLHQLGHKMVLDIQYIINSFESSSICKKHIKWLSYVIAILMPRGIHDLEKGDDKESFAYQIREWYEEITDQKY